MCNATNIEDSAMSLQTLRAVNTRLNKILVFPTRTCAPRSVGGTKLAANSRNRLQCASSASGGIHKLSVKGMKCEVCVKNVKNALLELDGVAEVKINLDSGTCEVATTKDIAREELVCMIEAAGFEVEQGLSST